MFYDATDDGSIAEFMKAQGFAPEDTGGGCKAWAKYHGPTNNRFYVWITWADGTSLFPARSNEDPRIDGGWLTGLYDNETGDAHEEWPERTLIASVMEANEFIDDPGTWFESTTYLSQQLKKFCDEHVLPLQSADELAAMVANIDDPSKADAEAYDWLMKFIDRWNNAASREDALEDARDQFRGRA
jgi:hypothetical protein